MNIRKAIPHVFSVIVFAAGVYMWLHPRHDRRIVMSASSTSKIYDAKAGSPKLHVADDQNQPITTDVYITTGVIWNAGGEAIEQTDVRRPVCLSFKAARQILDFSLIQTNEKGAAEFRIEESKCSNEAAPSVAISWKHLDPNYGAKFQVIYKADTESAVLADSDILGIGRVVWRDVNSKETSYAALWMSAAVTAVMFISTQIFARTGYLHAHFVSSFLLSVALAFVTGAVLFFVTKIPSPPF